MQLLLVLVLMLRATEPYSQLLVQLLVLVLVLVLVPVIVMVMVPLLLPALLLQATDLSRLLAQLQALRRQVQLLS